VSADSFYLPEGDDRFTATDATTSPWDERFQHGGPPAALLATCIEAKAGDPGLRLARLSLDFLGPIPKSTVEVEVRVVRPGRRTQLAEAVMSAEGRPAVVARAWHLAVDPSVPAPSATVPRDLPAAQPQRFFPGLEGWGYGQAIEWRFADGSYAEFSGRADVWTRVRVPLVAGTELNGMQRALILSDSANGVSAPLDLREWLFIPPGLTVHFVRAPVGEWVRMQAVSRPGDDGVGLTEAHLADAAGECAIVAQPILVARQ
jgi:hypothetical protein